MGEQSSDKEQDRPVVERCTLPLLQQPGRQQPPPGTAKETTRTTTTTTTTTLEASAELHTIATKQITENSECIKGSTPVPFIMTSPPDSSSEAVPTLTQDTKTAAAAAAAVATSSPMEGVIEEEITMLQIQQTPAEAGFATDSLLDGIFPIQTSFTSPFDAAPLTPVTAQSSVLHKECNVTWPQTPESVVQEQKQEQEQSEPMDEDVIMEESTEICPHALPISQETPAVARQDIPEAAGDEFKKEKSQQDMDESDSESEQDDDDCNEDDDDDDVDDEDDKEAPSDKKGKARDRSSSSHSIPREPTILSFDDAVYSAVPVSSELYIIPFCSKGFNWNADLFLKPHQRRNLGLDDLYRTLSTESRVSSSGDTNTTASSSDGSTDATSIDSRPSSSGASNNGHSHGSAIHVHEIWLSDLDTATILPA